MIISVPIILFYVLAGRTLESRTWRDISWIAATAQALAVVGVILLEILPVLTLIWRGSSPRSCCCSCFSDRPQQDSK